MANIINGISANYLEALLNHVHPIMFLSGAEYSYGQMWVYLPEIILNKVYPMVLPIRKNIPDQLFFWYKWNI